MPILSSFNSHRIVRILFLSLSFIIFSLSAVSGQCPLNCQDKVHASMPAEICARTFEPQDFLNGDLESCDPSGLQVIISHPFGTNNIDPAGVDRSHLGYTMVYKVMDPATGNSCWGYVTVEDKSGPAVPCKNVTISCFQVNQINKVTQEAQDACSDKGSRVTLNIIWKDYGCDSVGILGRICRNIISSDAWGNASYCTDTLTIRKDVLDSVCTPDMITLPCRLFCLNGNKLLNTLKTNPSGISLEQIINAANWDQYNLSKDKNSPFYPTPELLLQIQGHGDPLVEGGFFPGRLAGTKLLLDNLVIPNLFINSFFASLGLNPGDSFCIPLTDLVVPALNDSVLDLRKTISTIDIDDDGIVTYTTEANENFCKPEKKKTLMYPGLGGVCKLNVRYHDEILPICGNGFKIRREWLIADWCTGKEKKLVQYIVVEDKDVPNVVITGASGAPGPISSVVTGLKDTVYYLRSVNPHDCKANLTINKMNTWDCNKVDQTVQFIYTDPNQPGKVNVINEKVGDKGVGITLPVGVHIGRMSFVDECLNQCNFPILVLVNDMTPPNPVCNEFTRATVDPATCWARVYAKDLDNGSRDNCCKDLHFAVARMDTVEYYRKAYTDHLIKVCGWDGYNNRKTVHDFIVERYLSLYVFKEYIDLTECGSTQVVLRVFENCNNVRYDAHLTKLSEHQWLAAQDYGLVPSIAGAELYEPQAIQLIESILLLSPFEALTAFKKQIQTVQECEELVTDKILAILFIAIKQYAPQFIGIDIQENPSLQILIDFFQGETPFCLPEFKIKVDFDNLDDLFDDIGDDDINAALAASGFVPFFVSFCQSISNDCMVNIAVDDKTLPVCETPDDLVWYCDNAGGLNNHDKDVEYSYKWCASRDGDYTCEYEDGKPYNIIECVKENDGSFPNGDTIDPAGKNYGYYSCAVYGDHIDEHGQSKNRCDETDYSMLTNRPGELSEADIAEFFSKSSSWTPVYCRSWLCLDSYDAAGKVDAKSAFWSPELRSLGKSGPVQKAAASGKEKFVVYDNCWIDTNYTFKDDQFVDQCGNGWYQRTWTFKDKCVGEIKCSQKIYTYHRSDFEVMFPADLTLTCDATSGTGPDGPAGRPMVMDDECELVGVTFDDTRYDIVPDACYKIVRTWKLIDWCKYDPNTQRRYPEVIVDDRFVASADRACIFTKLKDNGDGYMTYTQIIKIIDTKAPVIAACKDTTICINNGYGGAGDEPTPMCVVPSYNSELFKATDNCTAADLIEFRWEIDLDNDGTIDHKSGAKQTRFSSSALPSSAALKVGAHKLYVIAEDNCGQEDTTYCILTVKDCKKPTPYCYNGIATVVMPTTKSVVVWAKDLDAGSYDNCTKKIDLKFHFGSNNSASDTFTCDDITNGVEQSVTVDIWVTDLTGNKDFCRTYLQIQDASGNVCPDKSAIAGSIAGKVMTESSEPVENVFLDIKSKSKIPLFKTDAKGSYAFSNLDMKADYSIIPKRDDDPSNGISTIDLVLLQKHILGIEPLNSAYKMIAADIDRSNDISAVDLVELRKLILTVYDKLPNNTSWRFVPKSHTFSNVSTPWGFPEQIDINSLSKDELNRDFIGVKVGDINATAVPHSLLGAEARTGGQSLKFRTLDRELKAGEEATIEFTADNFNSIEGYQFTLAMRGLDLKSVQSGVLKVSENNFGLTKLGQGFLTTSWNESKGITAGSNDVLFSITVKATKATSLSESLVINSKYTRAEAYSNTEALGVALEVGKKSVAGYALHQNTPNPFKSTTMINYELAKASAVTLKITDVTGKVVRVYNRDGQKGFNQISINRSDIAGAGVLYYTLETKDFSSTKKMIVVE